jgi:hypothetical protein
MALVFPNMLCRLCRQPIADEKGRLCTSHFIADDRDPMYQFQDSCMHRECFDAWEHRDAMTAKFRAFLALGGAACPDNGWRTRPDDILPAVLDQPGLVIINVRPKFRRWPGKRREPEAGSGRGSEAGT